MKATITIATALVLGAVAMAACSDGDDKPTEAAPPEALTGGGGSIDPTSSGSAGTGTGGGSTMPDPTCPHTGAPVFDPASLQVCPSYVCETGGHCVPNSLVPGDVSSFLGICNKDSFCVPDNFIETGGNFLLNTCTAVLGLEGRCLS